MDGKILILAGLTISGLITLILATASFKHRRSEVAQTFIALMLCMTCYSLGYALELSFTELSGIKWALRIEYLGISFFPPIWILLALQYAGRSRLLTPWVLRGLFCLSGLTLVLHVSNDLHGLYYHELSLNRSGPFPLADISGGVWYYVHLAYINIAFLVGVVVYVSWVLRSPGLYRKQASAMLLASLIPWFGHAAYHLGLSPYGIDIIPFTFILAGPLFALALFRFGLLSLSPIARDLVFERMNDPVIVLDDDWRVNDFNAAAAAVFSASTPLAVGVRSSEVLAAFPDLLQQFQGGLQDIREVSISGSQGTQQFRSTVTPIFRKNQRLGNILNLVDITEHKIMMNKLHELATIDELTGTNNRRQFMHLSQKELMRAKRYEKPCSIILLDLDHFKAVNDTYGHSVGDQVLTTVIDTIRRNVRLQDILGRYGGEEFVILLPETPPGTAISIAERLRGFLENQMLRVNGQAIRITASFGVSGQDPVMKENLDSLLNQADLALYRAKGKGRNRVEMDVTERP